MLGKIGERLGEPVEVVRAGLGHQVQVTGGAHDACAATAMPPTIT
jgi:hypothetical protein